MNKKKTWSALTLLACVVVVVYLLLHFIMKITIPGILPFAFAIVMTAMYRNEKIKGNRKNVKILLQLTITLEIIVGVMEIITALVH